MPDIPYGKLFPERQEINEVSPTSTHLTALICLAPSVFPLPVKLQPRNIKAVKWGTCRTCLIYFLSLREHLKSESESRSVLSDSLRSHGDLGSIPGVGRCPGERKGYPLQVFWPGEFCGLYSPWGCKESDTTE